MADEAKDNDRIAKVMARAGLASRRDAERMIVAGRVAVNGVAISSPALDVSPADKVTLDGKPIDAPQATRMWLYYKPLGLVTSDKDEKGRQTVFDTLPEGMPRVMSIGRLDLNSEGMLLLTNDGGLKRRLELPETGWLRKYRVRVNGRPDDRMLAPLRDGVTVEGETFLPMEISIDKQQGANAWLTVGLREGKNREIRRAMTEVGLIVNRLIRISYGPFRLNLMKPGDVTEVKAKVMREQLGSLLTGEPAGDDRPGRGDSPRKPAGRKPGGTSAGHGPADRKPRAGGNGDRDAADPGSRDRKPDDRKRRGASEGGGHTPFAAKPRAERPEGERRTFGKPREGGPADKTFGRRPGDAKARDAKTTVGAPPYRDRTGAGGARDGAPFDRKPRPVGTDGPRKSFDRRAGPAGGGAERKSFGKPRAGGDSAPSGGGPRPKAPSGERDSYGRKPDAAGGARGAGSFYAKPREGVPERSSDRKPRPQAADGAPRPFDRKPRPKTAGDRSRDTGPAQHGAGAGKGRTFDRKPRAEGADGPRKAFGGKPRPAGADAGGRPRFGKPAEGAASARGPRSAGTKSAAEPGATGRSFDRKPRQGRDAPKGPGGPRKPRPPKG